MKLSKNDFQVFCGFDLDLGPESRLTDSFSSSCVCGTYGTGGPVVVCLSECVFECVSLSAPCAAMSQSTLS